MSWHVDSGALADYARGEIDSAHAFSIEAHLLDCRGCQARVAELADRDRLERVWAEIERVVAVPARGPVEAALARLGVPEHVARLLAATPSLTLSWLLAVAGCLAFAVGAAHVSTRGMLVFLALAPLLPLAGVAAAYGPSVDPSYEVGVASPTHGFRLLLIRATAVLGTTTVLAAGAALALPPFGWLAAAWLLPSLALTTLALVLASYLRAPTAFGTVTFAWIAAVSMSAASAAHQFALFDAPGQLGFLVATVVAALVLARRRDAFDRGAGR